MRFFLVLALVASITAAPVVRVKNCPVVLPIDATPRIVGGNEASPRTRSHVVSFSDEGCGGSLISNRWVLTAAHCEVTQFSLARISGTNSSNGAEIPVKRVFNHPEYQFPRNDIALVELDSTAPSSASFMTVNGNPTIPEDGEYARVAGYGLREEGLDLYYDTMLRQVDVPVMNTQICIDRYFSVNSFLREDISETKHICAGYNVGGCDSCTADSGGPLFVYDSQNTPVQIAIVSFGYGCAREVPGGYTRVSTYVPWMKSVGAVFEEKTSRVARFGDSVKEADGPEPQPEENEEQADDNVTSAGSDQVSTTSPENSSEDASSSAPGPVESYAPVDGPDVTDSTEASSTPQASAKPSLPGRLPPHIAINPPSGESLHSPDLQEDHGGEDKPNPDTSASTSTEPVTSDLPPTSDIDESESDMSTDGSGVSDDQSNAAAAESEEYEPEEVEDVSPSNENDDNGSEVQDPRETRETNSSSGDAPVESGSGPGNDGTGSDVHRPAPVATGVDVGIEDGHHDEEIQDDEEVQDDKEVQDAQEDDDNEEAEDDKEAEDNPDESDESSINSETNTVSGGDSELGTENSESSDQGESETGGQMKDPSEGQNEDSPGDAMGPIFIPEPSAEVITPPVGIMSEEFDGLEPSISPEVSESPDVLSADSDFDAEGGGLGGLPITMIVIGTLLILAIVGYLVYYIASKREQ